jgi:imidazolonepropionase-like amidohydrolase
VQRTKSPRRRGSNQQTDSATARRFYILAGVASALLTSTSGTYAASGSALEPTSALAVLCGKVIDTQRGKLLGPSTVVIARGRIVSVQDGHHTPADARQVDLSTQTCLPGLIDSHTHLTWLLTSSDYSNKFRWNLSDYVVRSTVYARETLLAGFTSVRNLGDYENESVALRDAIDAGLLVGPRIFTAGPAIGSTGGHADPSTGYRQALAGDPGVSRGIVNGIDEAAKAVRLHYKQKDDLLKIMPSGGVLDESTSRDSSQMTLAEISAIVATARDYGLTVAAHAHDAESIKRAALAGVDSIEHATFLNDENIRLMRERGIWYVPTLSAGAFVTEKANTPGYYPLQVAAKAQSLAPQMRATLARAYKAGVKIAFGTDAGVFPHGQNAGEFALMVEAGVPEMYSLQAATIHAAHLLKRERDLGSIAPGKLADLIAVPGNPLDDIGVMTRVQFVMKEGVVYKRNGAAIDVESAQ